MQDLELRESVVHFLLNISLGINFLLRLIWSFQFWLYVFWIDISSVCLKLTFCPSVQTQLPTVMCNLKF